MLFFRQLDWKEFSNQPHIKKLPLNEQMQQFNFHLQQMSNLNYYQPKGQSTISTTTTPAPSSTPTPTPTSTSIPATDTPTPTPSPTPTVYQWTLYTGGRSAYNTCDTTFNRDQITAYTSQPVLDIGVMVYLNAGLTNPVGMTTLTQDNIEFYTHDPNVGGITSVGQCSDPSAETFIWNGSLYTFSQIFGMVNEDIDITNSTPQELVDYWCANGALGSGGNFGGPDSIILQKAVGNVSTSIEVGDRIIGASSNTPVTPGTQIAPDNQFLVINNAAQAFTTVSDGIVTAVATFTC